MFRLLTKKYVLFILTVAAVVILASVLLLSSPNEKNITVSFKASRHLEVVGDSDDHDEHHQQHLDDEEVEEEEEDPEENTNIPHILWFTYSHNVLETKEPIAIYENVVNTISRYGEAWDDIDAPVMLLDDGQCREAVEEAMPRLVPYFDSERDGKRRSDMCRVSALYIFGGYYFDVDLKVVTVMHPKKKAKLVSTVGSCSNGECFDIAFIASAPKHRILDTTLLRMLGKYKNDRDLSNLGGITMGDSFFKGHPFLRDDIQLLEKLQLDDDLVVVENEDDHHKYYPDLERQKGEGICNIVIHDSEKREVYFFETFVGYSTLCDRADN